MLAKTARRGGARDNAMKSGAMKSEAMKRGRVSSAGRPFAAGLAVGSVLVAVALGGAWYQPRLGDALRFTLPQGSTAERPAGDCTVLELDRGSGRTLAVPCPRHPSLPWLSASAAKP